VIRTHDLYDTGANAPGGSWTGGISIYEIGLKKQRVHEGCAQHLVAVQIMVLLLAKLSNITSETLFLLIVSFWPNWESLPKQRVRQGSNNVLIQKDFLVSKKPNLLLQCIFLPWLTGEHLLAQHQSCKNVSQFSYKGSVVHPLALSPTPSHTNQGGTLRNLYHYSIRLYSCCRLPCSIHLCSFKTLVSMINTSSRRCLALPK